MDKYDKIIFDFDDTIWSRDPKDIDCSIYNVNFINENLSDKAIIISGNSYKSIKEKLDSINLTLPNIWADANSILYEHGVPTAFISGCNIHDQSLELIKYLKKENILAIEPQLIGTDTLITNIKYKPIRNNRQEMVDTINSIIEKLGLTNCIAKATGKTTIDIVSIYNSKILVYNYLKLDKYKTLYIGDEVDMGNDKDIANLCTRKLRVNSVYDTKAILDCFGGIV